MKLTKSTKQFIIVALVLAAAYCVYMKTKGDCGCDGSSDGFMGWKKAVKAPAATLPKGMTPGDAEGAPMELNDPDSAKINVPRTNHAVATSLLPGPKTDDDFAEFAPVNIEGAKLVDASKYVRGMTSQSLRNSNMQLRSEPANPRTTTQWNQSTILPDTTRRDLEIGN